MTRKYPGKTSIFNMHYLCFIYYRCNMLRPTAPKEESEKRKPTQSPDPDGKRDRWNYPGLGGSAGKASQAAERNRKSFKREAPGTATRTATKATAGPKPATARTGRPGKTAGRAGRSTAGPGTATRPATGRTAETGTTAPANTTAYTGTRLNNKLESIAKPLMNNGTILNLQPSPTGL